MTDFSDVLIQSLPVFIVMISPENEIMMMNDSMLDTLGYSLGDVFGESLYDRFVPEREKKNLIDALEQCILANSSITAQTGFLAKDGREVPVEWHFRPVFGDDGVLDFILGGGIDLSIRREMELKLHESETRYLSLFRNNHTPMFIIDPADGAIIDANPAACDFYGHSPAVFTSMNIVGITAVSPRNEEADSGGVCTPDTGRSFFVHRLADGSLRNVEVFSSRAELEGKALLFSTVFDVTERNRMEEELLHEREEQNAMFDSLPIVIFYKNRRNRYIRVNRAFCEFHGLSRKQMEGRTAQELFPRNAEKFQSDDLEVIETGLPKHAILDLIETPRGTRWLQTDKAPFRDEQGEIIGIIGYSLDVTERKEAERHLLEEHARLETLFRNERMISEIASIINSPGTIEAVIRKIAKVSTGTLPISRVCIMRRIPEGGKFVPYDSCRCRPPTDEDAGNCMLFNGESAPHGHSWIEEVISVDSIGIEGTTGESIRSCGIGSFVSFPIETGGALKGIVMFFREETGGWFPQEQDLFRTIRDMIVGAIERDDNFKARIEAEKRHAEALRISERSSRLASIGTLAAGIAHEINQPLTALKVKVDSMIYWGEAAVDFQREEVLENLAFISQQSERIDDIIKHMRALARQEKSREPVDLDINRIIEEVLSLLRQRISAHGIRIDMELDPALPPVRGHRTLIHQVIINLIVNAIHSLDEKSGGEKSIIVTTGVGGGAVMFEVCDNGPGIPEMNLSRIFDPFFTTKPGGEGMGIGLSICYNIVTGMGGVILAENRPGGGARLFLSFPVAPDTKGAPE